MTGASVRSHHDIISQRRQQFEADLQRGEFRPLLLQQVVGTFLLLLVPLVIPHRSRSHSRLLRYGFFSIILCVCAYTIYTVRAISLENGYGVGLVTSWFLVWSATLLVFNDVQQHFKRIEKVTNGQGRHNNEKPEPNGSPKNTENGETVDGRESTLRLCRTKPSPIQEPLSPKGTVYRWQPYPRSFGHRLDWVLDLIFNFRGPNWNWRVRALPPMPDSVTKDLGGQAPTSEMEGSRAVQDHRKRLSQAFHSILRNYVALDVVKVLMNRDPFFRGVVSPSPPPPFPFHFLAFSPLLVRFYRLLLGLIGVCCALQFLTSFNTIFFLGLSRAFPQLSRAITHQPLDEAWLYPEQFGPVSAALDHGLAGCWSLWWHQLFRFGFSEIARFVFDLLPLCDRSSDKSHRMKDARRAIQALIAFCVSGLLHASGSYTQFATTKPSGQILFFVLQAPGILVQRFLSRAVLPRLLPFNPPRWLRRATNFAFLVAWFILTGPFIVDDFARGGIWLFEPIPISPLRGMGFGVEGDGWLCWKGPVFRWWEGETWWQSGIRIV